jgi:hypothetical protein
VELFAIDLEVVAAVVYAALEVAKFNFVVEEILLFGDLEAEGAAFAADDVIILPGVGI